MKGSSFTPSIRFSAKNHLVPKCLHWPTDSRTRQVRMSAVWKNQLLASPEGQETSRFTQADPFFARVQRLLRPAKLLGSYSTSCSQKVAQIKDD